MLEAHPEELEALESRLQAAQVAHRAIRDADVDPEAILAIGLVPAPRKEVKRYVSSFPLLR